jgi:hypothetical protein
MYGKVMRAMVHRDAMAHGEYVRPDPASTRSVTGNIATLERMIEALGYMIHQYHFQQQEYEEEVSLFSSFFLCCRCFISLYE